MRLLERLSKRPSGHAPRQPSATFDADSITDTIERALTAAGLDPRSGPAGDATATVERTLREAGLATARPEAPTATSEEASARGETIVEPPRSPAPVLPGMFTSHSYSNAAGTRAYKLYVPATSASDVAQAPRPLVVMLHGCTQSPDDFAAGTRMNALADQLGFLVAYPAQTARDNGSKCWNWFRAEDQRNGRGEPSLIAGIVAAIAADHGIDPHRVFVAGLSAGAAMAVILGQTYPDVFAAIGAHSGLPYGAAHDMPSAFAAMQGGSSTATAKRTAVSASAIKRPSVPTIVFHGDADRTVNERNGIDIVQDATASGTPATPLHEHATPGTVEDGRAYTRTVFTDAASRPRAEYWRIHGAGHAWSGGSASVSYTDPKGPDASAEMVRFFLQQPAPGTGAD